VAAQPVETAQSRWQAATQAVDVLAAVEATPVQVVYLVVTARLAIAVTGLPAGAPAAITVTGPTDFTRSATGATALDLLQPGAYTVTAANVTVGGTVYRPTLASQAVTLAASATPTTVTVGYAVGSGSLALTVGGLPSGVDASVAVRGPGGFARDLTGTASLGALDPGLYTITAAPRATADRQAIYSAPAAQTVTVTAGATATASITYAPFELAYQQVASGLASPTFLTAPPGDARLFVVEQGGRVRIVKNGALLAAPFLDLSARISTGGERGLLSMAFDPAFAANGNVFVYLTNPDGDLAVERYTASPGADVASATPTPVITIPHRANSNHNGGLVTFGPDGMLYMGTGDGGGAGDGPGNAQNPNVLLGKLLRLDVRTLPYAIPASNPFVGQAGKRGEIWAYGLRNPWRWDFDDASLYIADVGQNLYEELDVAPATLAGVNYGWNTMEATHCFSPSSGCSTAGLRLPVAEYDHGKGCSITGGFVYRGAQLPEVTGHFFYSDYCTGFLASLTGDAARGFVTRPWSVPNAGNVLSFGEDGSGELYVLTASGTVQKVVRR
jgi:glucose/arabinose dehydrogenase